MLTPPYHFAIVAAPIAVAASLGSSSGSSGSSSTGTSFSSGSVSGSVSGSSSSGSSSASRSGSTREDPGLILYRGALPAARNAPFVRRLGIRTLVCMRKKPLKDDDPLRVWAGKRGMDVKWVKAEKMGEETLGMDQPEVGEVLQILLNPAAYPIYLADIDGSSHTTLVVACLRKLQGWDAESIVNEIERFENGHEDLPLIPFITSYLSTSQPSKDDPALVLPSSPYPAWLWPSPPPTQARPPQPSTRTSASSTAALPLPFPNPLTARRHPSMRLTFPAAPPAMAPLSPSPKTATAARSALAPLARVSTVDRRPVSPRDTIGASPPSSMSERDRDRAPQPTHHKVSFHDPMLTSGLLTRSPMTLSHETTQRWGGEGLDPVASPEKATLLLDDDDDEDDEDDPDGAIADEEDDEGEEDACSSGPEDGDEYGDDQDEHGDEDEDDDEDDEDEDDDEDDEDDENEAVSQYISALDLAGYG